MFRWYIGIGLNYSFWPVRYRYRPIRPGSRIGRSLLNGTYYRHACYQKLCQVLHDSTLKFQGQIRILTLNCVPKIRPLLSYHSFSSNGLLSRLVTHFCKQAFVDLKLSLARWVCRLSPLPSDLNIWQAQAT